MKWVTSRHGPGVVGFITADRPRYYEFTDALERTIVPMGTHQFRAESCNPAANCNDIIRNVPPEAGWVWFLGDDHDWDPGLLMALLDHEVDMVVPLVPRRQPPFLPVVYAKYEPAVNGEPNAGTRTCSWRELSLAASWGLYPIQAAGSAGLLIRRHVWEGLLEGYGEPLFRLATGGPATMAEDVDLTYRATKMGFELYADPMAYMSHLRTAAISVGRNAAGNLIVGTRMGSFDAVITECEPMAPIPLDVTLKQQVDVIT